MAASVPQINTQVEPELEAQFKYTGFKTRLDKLNARIENQGKIDELAVSLAEELDTDAKIFLDAAEKKRKYLKEPLLEAIDRFDQFWHSVMDTAAAARATCTGVGVKNSDGGIVGRYNEALRLAAEEADRKREAEALAAAKAQQQAEVTALVEQAAATNDPTLLEEAQQLEQQTPVPTAIAPTPVPSRPGMSIGNRKPVLKQITDPYELMKWFMESKDRFNSMWPVPAKFQAFIEGTVNAALARGLQPKGVETHYKSGVRNLNR